MANLAIVEKIESVAVSPKTKFMQALAASLPRDSIVLAPALVRQAVTIIKASETLQKCSEYSLFNSIAEVAQSGLSLDLHLGQAFLVPFSGTATVMYGYRGLIELARRSGEVADIVGEIRYAKDEFKITYGTDRKLIHIPFDGPPSKRGERLGAYAICEFLRSRSVFEYMTMEEIDRIKNAVVKRAKAKGKTSIWETENESEMIRKTPIRRLAKRLPQSPALIPFVQAAIRDEYRAQGIHQVVEVQAPVAEAIEELKIEQPPEPQEPERRTSRIEEKQTDVVGPITTQQWEQLYDNFCVNGKLTVQQIIGQMKKLGHGGNHKAFPAAKFDKLVEVLQKASKK